MHYFAHAIFHVNYRQDNRALVEKPFIWWVMERCMILQLASKLQITTPQPPGFSLSIAKSEITVGGVPARHEAPRAKS